MMPDLPKGHTILSRDDREICSIYWPHEGAGVMVGEHGVTRIEAYDENGSMSHVPWLAVFKGDHLASRTRRPITFPSFTNRIENGQAKTEEAPSTEATSASQAASGAAV